MSKLKIGFVGVGWIGKSRLEAIHNTDKAEIFALVDPNEQVVETIKQEFPDVIICDDYSELLSLPIDGVVIATPSALHYEQTLQALQKGKAVFCQKPLGRTKEETETLVYEAKKQDLLLHVDFSYRFTKALTEMKNLILQNKIGKIFACNLIFHNAYGPDKSWYLDPLLAGGGCLIDLGIHLIDSLCWILGPVEYNKVTSAMFQNGHLIQKIKQVEDYFGAHMLINNQISTQIACSWFLHAGQDAQIEITLFGDNGALSFQNINGSFYDFQLCHFNKTQTEILNTTGDHWPGAAAKGWVEKLSIKNNYDSEAALYIHTAEILDHLYAS